MSHPTPGDLRRGTHHNRRMDIGVIGVGYEGRSIEEFVAHLRTEGVHIVVDARLIPRCNRRGFSRNVLQDTLAAHNISYVHYEVLGVPEFDQVGFRGDRAAAAAATTRYRARLAAPVAQRVIRDLVVVSRRRRVAVMTMSAEATRCHRATLMAEIERRTPAAAPIDEVLAEFPDPKPVAVVEEDRRSQVEREIDALLAEVDAGKR